MIVLQRVQRLLQRAGNLGDLLRLLRRQIVNILVDRVGGRDPVLDAVQSRHQHGGEREVGVGRGIRAAELHPFGRRRSRIHRDARRRGAVALGHDQVHRRLVTRHQPLVGVGGGGAESHQCMRMLEQPADVPAAQLRGERPALGVEKQVFLVLPQALMAVHAARIVGENRFRHEGGHFAVLARDVLAEVFVEHHVVGHAGERRETHVDLILPGGGDLVVVHFHLDAGLHHRQHDPRADVLQRVMRRHREVAFLVTRLVAQVAAAVGALVPAGVPLALGGFHVIVAAVLVLREADRIEYEELELRSKVASGRDPSLFQVHLRLLRDETRIARVGLLQDRVENVADDRQRRHLAGRIDKGGGGVGLEQHVRFLDFLEAADRGTVKPDAFIEQVGVYFRQRD